MSARIQHNIGLDIGSYSVKGVQMTFNKADSQVTHSNIVAVQGNLLNAVKELMKSFPAPAKNVRISLTGPSLLIRRISLPTMTKNELKSAIRFEAEKHIPFPINDCILDSQILSQKSGQKEMSVLLVAAKRDFIQERLKLLSDAGLEADLIDVDIFSLYNAFEKFRDSALNLPKTYGLLNIGHQTSSLLIMREGTPFFVREISSGGSQVTKALMAQKNISEAEADQLKKNRDQSNLEVLKQATHQGFEKLLEGLNHSINYIENEAGEMVECVWISGGGALSTGAAEVLSEEIGRTFMAWEGPKVIKERPTEISVALGTALRN